jgi:hypothetical protein
MVSRLNTSDTDDYNLSFGVDGRLGVGQSLTFEGWAALTETPVGAGVTDTRTGFNSGEYGFSGGVDYLTRDWEMSADYRQIGEGFNPEVGFVNRREYRFASGRVLWHWRTANVSWFREFRPHVSWNQYWALDGFSETYLIHIDNHFQFENGAFFQLPGFNITGEGLEEPFEIRPDIVIPAGNYDNLDWEFRANTNRSAPLSASVGWAFGGFYSGTRFGPNATLSYRYRDRLTTSFRVNYFDVDLNELGSFTTSVVGLNTSYSFTPRLYLQANVQYNDDTHVLGSNVRLGWLDTAGTGLFLVYNDSEAYDLWGDEVVRAPRARQFVIKYSKLFDLTR